MIHDIIFITANQLIYQLCHDKLIEVLNILLSYQDLKLIIIY